MFLSRSNWGQEQITKQCASNGPIFAKAWWKALSKEKNLRVKVEWKDSGDSFPLPLSRALPPRLSSPVCLVLLSGLLNS